MERRSVQSNNLRSVGYDAGRGQMEIEFHNGRIYQYDAVPKILHDGLLVSRSAGKFFDSRIRNQFRATEITKEK